MTQHSKHPKAKDYPYVAERVDFGDPKPAYVIRFVDFPTIVGQGRNFAAALREARGNLKAYFVFMRLEHSESSIPAPTVKK